MQVPAGEAQRRQPCHELRPGSLQVDKCDNADVGRDGAKQVERSRADVIPAHVTEVERADRRRSGGVSRWTLDTGRRSGSAPVTRGL